jgi:hypothetical protein
MKDLLDLGATLRTVEISKDVGEHPGVEGEEIRLKNFHIKGEAFSSSSFEEILYLDSFVVLLVWAAFLPRLRSVV